MDMNSVLYGEGWQPGVTTAPMPQAEASAAPPMAPVQLAQAPAQAQAPANQQQYEQDWLTKMRTDPAISQAMMFAASRLMQGQKPGQSQAGMLGDALAVGMTAHSMLTENERKAGLEERNVASQEQLRGAQAEEIQTNTQHKKDLFPETQAKLAQEVKNLRAQGRLQEANALIQEFKSDPQRLSEQWDLDRKLTGAQINHQNASAGAANANAAFVRTKAAAGQELLDQGDPNAVLHGTRSGAGAAKEKLAEIKTYIKEAYPEKTDQEVAKMVVDMQSGKKGENVEMLVKLMESENKTIRSWATEQLAGRAGYKPGGDKPAPAAGKGKEPTQADWDKARNSVEVGQTYTGPDGLTYKRKN